MGDAHGDQPVEERVRRLILDQMMGQNSCRLLGAHSAEAPRPQVLHQATQRRIFPDEPAISFPGNEVDMDVRLGDARCLRRGASRSRS